MFKELDKIIKKFFKSSDDFVTRYKPIDIMNEEIYEKIEDKCLTEYKDPTVASEIADRIYTEFMKEFEKWIENLDVRGR